ncbi:phosphoribosylformylglycinamidine synthase subunit PurL [Candidatus Fermentibacteria bacterium]|nr:phosphoribosylformylglycinamidine synthase subunit PurL [Candidatus Fermentibacteria bacterium]
MAQRDSLESTLRREIDLRGLAMTVGEAARLADTLGRMPTPLELHLFDIMWSEHCSYKSSKALLRMLPTAAEQVVLGPGEDAGVVSFCSAEGMEYDLVLAHESHNHPSQVLPEEGAATGVGGIVRDVYCMGADVVGVLDLLRFGDPKGKHGERSRSIARGVVRGIWKYGNALGVPNLGGDTVFDEGYDDNCLVNVVAVGIGRHDRIVHSYVPSCAAGEPYVLVLVGKPTDDTGFGGATFASSDLDEESDKGAVQVADPFLKRVLTIANAAVAEMLHQRGIEFGFKDLGAGGIACVSSEMAGHSGMGIVVDLDRVPTSLEGIAPEVLACSETQERYGLAVPEAVAEDVLEIYNVDYELPRLLPGARAAVVGRFQADPVYRVIAGGEEVASTPVSMITEGIRYERPRTPAGVEVREPPARPVDPLRDLASMLSSVPGASRMPVWSYYDSEVRGSTVFRPGEADAVVIRPLPGSDVGLAVSGDGNPWFGELDPYLGGAHAVGEAVRNVVCTGAVPLAATDCLNYGNPENPEVFWQFARGIEGIRDACGKLGMLRDGEPLPIITGNVSFYNQSQAGKAVPPSPMVAVCGRLEDASAACDLSPKRPGDLIVLLGPRRDELGGSLYYRECLRHRGGKVPQFRGDLERSMGLFVLDLVARRLVRAAHDVSEGGVLLAAAEMALAGADACRLGVRLKGPSMDPVFLYSETPGYLLEVSPRDWESLEEVPEFADVVGEVTDDFSVSTSDWSLDLAEVLDCHRDLLHGLIWREEGV